MQTPTLQQLLEAGVHFGHQVRRGHPRMRQYIYGARDGVHIIDLTLSEKGLKDACDYVYSLGKAGGVLLFVGTKKQAQEIVREQAQKLNAPFLAERWIGGFLTNFEEISKNIKRLRELRDQKEKGQLKKYTKKEQLLIDRRISKLQKDLGGVIDLEKTPEAIFVLDAARDFTAVKEAQRISSISGKKVTVVAISDTNSDPTLIDYPIPGNDDAIKSIRLITEAVAGSYGEGLKQAGKDAAKAQEKAAKEEAKRVADEAKAELPEEVLEEVAEAEEVVEKKSLEESERKVE